MSGNWNHYRNASEKQRREFNKNMAGVNKSESKSEEKNFAVDPITSIIPAGDEHNRCRETLINDAAGVNIFGEADLTPLMFAARERVDQGRSCCEHERKNWIYTLTYCSI